MECDGSKQIGEALLTRMPFYLTYIRPRLLFHRFLLFIVHFKMFFWNGPWQMYDTVELYSYSQVHERHFCMGACITKYRRPKTWKDGRFNPIT